MEWRQVELAVLQDRNVTVVEASWDGLSARGSAKREPGDRHVAGIGVNLATARALRRLAEQVEADARRMVDVCNPPCVVPAADPFEVAAAAVKALIETARTTLASMVDSGAAAFAAAAVMADPNDPRNVPNGRMSPHAASGPADNS